MTPAELAINVRYKTRTNSTTFTDADMLALLKLRYVEVAAKLLATDEDLFFITYTENLVASSTTRQYALQDDLLERLQKVSAKLDGTNWVTLKEINITSIDNPIVTEANITNLFNNSQLSKENPNGARFDLTHRSIIIYSGTIDAVTSGLETRYAKYPEFVTDMASVVDMSAALTNTTHGMPRPVHELLARGLSIDYKLSREKPIPLNEKELRYDIDLQTAMEAIKHGSLDREVIGQLPDKSDRGNEGADF